MGGFFLLQILQEIGDGPQGTVLLVEDKRFNKELYALKKVSPKEALRI